MLRFVLITLTSCILFSCSGQDQGDNHIQLHLTVESASGEAILEKFSNEELVPVDSFEFVAGEKLSRKILVEEPNFFRLTLDGAQIINLVLSNEDVEILATGSPNGDAEIKGSTDTDYFLGVGKKMNAFQSQVQRLNQEVMKARSEGDQAEMQAIQDEFESMRKELTKEVKKDIWAMGNSVSALLSLNFLDMENEGPFLDSLAERFEKELPNSEHTKSLITKVENQKKLDIGKVAPEIELPNPDGEMVKLSSLRGNIVLVDFWAAWCRPCRVENPNVVRMYQQYNDKGFEVFGVSFDRNHDDWVKAIEQDGLDWAQVSDLKYFNSKAAEIYNVNAIPFTVLLDREGKIIAKNLRGPELEKKLAELFGS